MEEPGKYSSFRRLIAFLKPHRKTVATGLSALIITTLVGLIPPLIAKYVLDQIVANKSHMTDSNRLKMAILCGIGSCALYLIIAFFTRTRFFIMHILGEKFILDLRQRMYKHLQTLSLTFYETRRRARLCRG